MSFSTKLLRINEVCAKTTLGKSTIWLKVAQGKFPKPAKLSSAISVWKESAVDNWINSHFNSTDDLHVLAPSVAGGLHEPV